MKGNCLSRRDLIEITEKASGIDDRLGEMFFISNDREGDSSETDSIVNLRLEAWRQAAANGSKSRFLRRLSFDGLDEETAKLALRPAHLRKGAPLPDWTCFLRAALMEAVPTLSVAGERFLKQTEPVPFEDILASFVLAARRKLKDQAGKSYCLLSSDAHATLERSLLKDLAGLSSQALFLEFSLLREQTQPAAVRQFQKLFDPDPKSFYRLFTERMLNGGLAVFLKEYAVLARLLSQTSSFWIETCTDFLNRLSKDQPEIQHLFGVNCALDTVVQIKTGLSDKHCGGRGVLVLTFASGLKLVYKPKSLGLEAAVFDFLSWLNELGAPLPFKILKLINQSVYGWIEYIEHLPCQTKEEANRYYLRAGILLALVYVLEGTDCHYENIIACGEHPVLIDMETLLQPQVRAVPESDAEEARSLAFYRLRNSVLQTDLLPHWRFGRDHNVAFDLSGLGGGGEQDLPYKGRRLINVNTDDMSLKEERYKLKQQANIPVLDGAPLSLIEHAEEVITGFKQMYQFLQQQKSVLLAPGSPFYKLSGQQVRFIFRNTNVYSSINRKLLDPQYLRNGADRSIVLELLSRAQVDENNLPSHHTGSEVPKLWPLHTGEKKAMEQGDIPFFTAFSNSTSLEAVPGLLIKNCFTAPSFSMTADRLENLNEIDMKQQIGYIRTALNTRHSPASTGMRPEETDFYKSGGKPADSMELSSEELINCAVAIAQELQNMAIWASDGSATWIAPQLLLEARRYQLQPVGWCLYDGVCGITLFLAAISKIDDKSGFRELALAGLQQLNRILKSEERNRALSVLGIGGALGLGSIVYALTHTAQILAEDELLETAHRAAGLITVESIEGDRSFDIMSGAAGAILGLLSLYKADGSQSVLETALTCGRHLLANRIVSGSGQAWPTLGGKLLTGFSHGAAGIAYSLLKLYQATGEEEFREAATAAISYERDFFSPAVNNWQDLREERSDRPYFMTTWCHGAPGIGLSRLLGVVLLDSPDIRREIEASLNTTLQVGLQKIDHLCCGNLGRADILLEASRRLSQPDLYTSASTLAAQAVARAEQNNGFYLNLGLSGDVFMPGLFQGTSGIGYALLRLACPDLLPCVLMWE